ncbi:hypothetical protein [Gordonia neofelifaecis]|uniref:Secreted protein n=1 Tax=Gordonia neofelifaecis NRRL B-59395 TaxID=644548 RepID=F1YH41_9ACTN|nr:hypothetical protein [Gordonia neofelifaecis]EGD55956.1 hypothetical protein SCNU_06940 [Gordonia neofelifaecis NRRL B-59395]
MLNTRLHASALAVCAALLAGCSAGTTDSSSDDDGHEHAHVAENRSASPRLVVAYDGGVRVLDGETLAQVADLPRDGFLRLNDAGDSRHVFVTTEDGFALLDAGTWHEAHGDHRHYRTAPPRFTDTTFDGSEPGHAVAHDGRVTLFFDGTGEVKTVEQSDLGDAQMSSTDYRSPHAHHGVAVTRADGSLVISRGDDDARTGIAILGPDRRERATSTNCPGVHGEASAAGGVLTFGCEDGVVVVREDTIRKVTAPDAYGRIGNQRGSEQSTVILGDYKTRANLPDDEIERPTRFSLIDTETGDLRLVDLPAGYSFRSLARGPNGEAIVLGTDGFLYVFDASTAQLVAKHQVLAPWREPIDWQEPMASVVVLGDLAYVNDPAQSTIRAVDLATGQTRATADLGVAAAEMVPVSG